MDGRVLGVRPRCSLWIGHSERRSFDTCWVVHANTANVISSTLQKAEWNNSTIIRGAHLEEEIQKLKKQSDGDIGITGSIMIAQALMQRNLINEYDLLTFLSFWEREGAFSTRA